jgi:hypothetical protein
MAGPEMTIFTRTFDLRERLEEARLRRGKARVEKLREADEALARLRTYVRPAVGGPRFRDLP